MLKKLGLIILLCGILLTACQNNPEPFRETASEESAEETYVEGNTIAGEEETTKAPHPVFDELFVKSHNHPERGRYTMYEYNEENNAWDLVYVNMGKRLVWEISEKKMFVEYEGERTQVSWVMNMGRFTNTYSHDLNQDGVDELILMVDQRDESASAPFVFDVAKGEDLSPVYGVFDEDGDVHSSNRIYLYEEYALPILEAMNQAFERGGYSLRFEPEEDGSFELTGFVQCKLSDSEGNYGNRIFFSYYPMAGAPAVWSCTAEFVFEESGCRVENIRARTWVDLFLEKIDVVTENSLKAELEYDDDNRIYYFTFTGEDITVSYSVTVGQQRGDIVIEYRGEEYPVNWQTGGGEVRKEYFEMQDVDNDGYDELVWYEIKRTEEKEEVQSRIYDFQSRSEIVQE